MKLCIVLAGMVRQIKYRFTGGFQMTIPERQIYPRTGDKETISQLLEIQWWNWSKEKIARNINVIQTGNIDKLKQFM